MHVDGLPCPCIVLLHVLVNATAFVLADPAARGIRTALKHKTKITDFFPHLADIV